MKYRERVAQHEAAHAVLALVYRTGLTDAGIDLDRATSVPGATGVAGVNVFQPDLSQPESDQFNELGASMAIICAGAAADARITGEGLGAALDAQPGDRRAAEVQAALYPFGQPGAGQAEAIDAGLKIAEKQLARPEVWAAVQAVASACVLSGGTLTKAEIENIAEPLLP